jgi:ubiquinone/menaquinone biosynthesis C-methylase UbiE
MEGGFVMSINFHNEKNRTSYAKREVDETWLTKVRELVNIKNKKVIDVGCGGGIYTKALVDLGASEATAVDFSQQMLSAAKENCREYRNISFAVGNALDIRLPSEEYECILERALIHHISDLKSCFEEAYRLLVKGGTLIIQDRTPEDCLLEGNRNHIRGYFFSKYPELVEKEISRRHTTEKVIKELKETGFTGVQEHQLWETRKIYSSLQELADDLMARTGRSILHELSDSQLTDLVEHITNQLKETKCNREIIEKDRWTMWVAKK